MPIHFDIIFKHNMIILVESTQQQLVKMVRMGLVASISAVETVRVITLVTKQLEPALNALLGGKIIIVTKVRKCEK